MCACAFWSAVCMWVMGMGRVSSIPVCAHTVWLSLFHMTTYHTHTSEWPTSASWRSVDEAHTWRKRARERERADLTDWMVSRCVNGKQLVCHEGIKICGIRNLLLKSPPEHRHARTHLHSLVYAQTHTGCHCFMSDLRCYKRLFTAMPKKNLKNLFLL